MRSAALCFPFLKENELMVENTITIDFKALFMEIMDKFLVILLGGIAGGLAMFLLCSTVLHLNYESTTKIYIRAQSTDATTAYVSLEISSLLTTDYSEMIIGRDIIEDAIEYFDNPLPYEKFVKKVKVENPVDTRILVISVSDKDPYLARSMAVYIRDKAIEMIEQHMGVEGISVIEEANLPVRNRISPKMLSAIVAFLTSCLIGLVVVLRFLMGDRLISTDDIEEKLHLPVIGTVMYEKGMKS